MTLKKVWMLVLFSNCIDHALGEGLVQETFMKTWVYLVKKGKSILWKLFSITFLNNLIIDEYRKHKTSSLDTMQEKGFDPSTGIPIL